MATLSGGDAERLLRFVADAENLRDDEPFTPALLCDLGRLIGADHIEYAELDAVRGVLLTAVERTGDHYEIPFPDPLWHEVVPIYPVRVAHRRGYPGALKISDFLSRADLRRSRLGDWFRMYGVTHTMEMPLFPSRWRPRWFFFDRFSGRDFCERDRNVLDTLRPHLARLWRAARARRLLGAALAQLDRADGGSHAVVLLDRAGSVDFASRQAQRLLEAHYPGKWRRRVPPEIADWVESRSHDPLVHRCGGRLLVVDREEQTLLLREKRVVAPLTDREQEVLAWVARGKTNPEIAELLWLAPSTVRKHLENVYAKLGVTTRTAAVARFLGLVEAEAS